MKRLTRREVCFQNGRLCLPWQVYTCTLVCIQLVCTIIQPIQYICIKCFATDAFKKIKDVIDQYKDKENLKKKYKGHRKEDKESISDAIIPGAKLLELLDAAVADDDHKTPEKKQKELEEKKAAEKRAFREFKIDIFDAKMEREEEKHWLML